MAPEDNPADDVQPTKEEWEEYERERQRCREVDTQQIQLFREAIERKEKEAKS